MHNRPPLQVLTMVWFSFQLFVVWVISLYLFFVWGWWQSNKLPFGKWSDTCWKITAWSCRFCPTPMHTALSLSHFHLLALALVVMKKTDRKISPYSASKAQWSQRWNILGRQNVVRLLGHKLKCRYVLFLWDLIQGFDQKHRDRGQHKHHPRDCSLRARDLPTFL